MSKIKQKGEYNENGQRTGLWEFYQFTGDKLSSRYNYLNGVLHGNCISYFPTGEIRHEGKHLRGRNKGLWIKYCIDRKIEYLMFWL